MISFIICVPERGKFLADSERMALLAKKCHVHYDGWGTPVEE